MTEEKQRLLNLFDLGIRQGDLTILPQIFSLMKRENNYEGFFQILERMKGFNRMNLSNENVKIMEHFLTSNFPKMKCPIEFDNSNFGHLFFPSIGRIPDPLVYDVFPSSDFLHDPEEAEPTSPFSSHYVYIYPLSTQHLPFQRDPPTKLRRKIAVHSFVGSVRPENLLHLHYFILSCSISKFLSILQLNYPT